MSTQKQTLEKHDKNAGSNVKGSHLKYLRYSDEAKSAIKDRNPFGGRRMIFESFPERNGELQETINESCKTKNNYSSIQKKADIKEKTNQDESSFYDQKEERSSKNEDGLHSSRNSNEAKNATSNSKCDTGCISDRWEIEAEIPKPIKLRPCHDLHGTAPEREVGGTNGQDNRTKFAAAREVKLDRALRNNAKDTTPLMHHSKNTSEQEDIRCHLHMHHSKSLQKSSGPKHYEKYTILFTNECVQDNIPFDKSDIQSQDRFASGDGEAISKSSAYCSSSNIGKTSKPKERKFVIRREKHEAENGREEDATYTIHVCSQSICDSSNNVLSNSKSKKKETRGDIFRKNASYRCAKRNRFESPKTYRPDGKESVCQEELTTPGAGQDLIKRLSSLSPPRQKRSEKITLKPRRAQSEHDNGRRAGTGCGRRSIRLIDHLEKKERAQTDANDTDLNVDILRTIDRSKSKHYPNEAAKRISEENWVPKQRFSSTSDFASENFNFSREAPEKPCSDERALPEKETKRMDSFCLERLNIEEISDATEQGEMKYADLISQEEESKNVNWMVKRNLHKAALIHKKDVACQYSPPMPTQPCCLCDCHKMERGFLRIPASLDRTVAVQRDHTVKKEKLALNAGVLETNGNIEDIDGICLINENEAELNDNGKFYFESEGEAQESVDEEEEKEESFDEVETEDEEERVRKTCPTSDEHDDLQKHETKEGDEGEESFVQKQRHETYKKEGNNTEADINGESDDCRGRNRSNSSSSTPTQNVSKNNSTAKTAPLREKNRTNNSFREIVESAKRKSCINVCPVNKNSSYMKTREPPTPGESGEVGHFFIGDYLLCLWRKQVLCDVRVNVNNTHFLAHKIVLAAFSDVFTPTTPYPEPALQFTIPNSSPEAVYRVFKYIYTASMDVKDDQLEETLHVGLFLGINEIKDVILEILSQPTLENVEMYIDILNRCGIPASLMDYPALYQNNLMQLIHKEKFLDLTTEELESILRDPNVLVETEVDTLHALAVWAQYKPLERVPEVPKLLDFIIFEVISPDNIAKILQLYDPIFVELGARNKISEVFRFHALQLSSKVGPNEGFVENVPGIAQDPLMDRVSYIPSQGSMAKYQDRPTLPKPSIQTDAFEPKPSIVYSIKNKSFESTQGKPSATMLRGSGYKSFGQSSMMERRSTKSHRSFNFNESQSSNRKRKKSKLSNRSNNSAVLSNCEADEAFLVSDKPEEAEEIFENCGDIKTCRNGKEGCIRQTIEPCEICIIKNCRRTRRDHWSSLNIGGAGKSKERLKFEDGPKPWCTKGRPSQNDKEPPQRRSVISDNRERRPLMMFSHCQGSGIPTSSKSSSKGSELTSLERPQDLSDLFRSNKQKRVCICGSSNPPAKAEPKCKYLNKCLLPDCDGTKHESNQDAYDDFRAKALDNKNSNASCFFDLV